jgi:hypothetical protein
MRLADLAILYVLAGAGAAVAALIVRRGVVDAALLVPFWPLYGPFLLTTPGAARSELSGLAALLPDEAVQQQLAERLRVARGKVLEIDGLLVRADFSEAEATSRLLELRAAGGSETAITAVTLRLNNLRRLRALRARFARELDEVGELLAQLRTQAEVLRLGGARDPGTDDLVRELCARVEGLDLVMDSVE